MAFQTSGCLGVDFTATPTTAEFDLGTVVDGTDGSKWIYVKASAAITQYDCVAIDEDYNATPMTKALADAGHRPGFAQVAFASADYGWVALEGSNISARLGASCAADVQLYTTAGAGILDDTAASQTAIRGVVAVVLNTTSGGAKEVIAVNPSTTATP